MKILLIGEYSNMHTTLARAFRAMGHEVLVVSSGDGWKNFPRDIDISRRDGFLGSLSMRWRLVHSILPKLKGFDVVHLINPQWIEVVPSLTITLNEYLKAHNRLFSLGLYGDDYYVMKGQAEGVFLYSDTHCYGEPINREANRERIEKWMKPCREICEKTAEWADCMIASLYEYYRLYQAAGFGKKLHYVGSPIELVDAKPRAFKGNVKILVGEQTTRAKMKGTDQLIPLLDRADSEHLSCLDICKVHDVPFVEYQKLLGETDVLVDQLYSYTPAMNALEAMKRGTVVISGGEEEYYDFIGEKELRPIINLMPFRNGENLEALRNVLFDKNKLRRMSAESIEFVRKYHDATEIARQYIRIWEEKLSQKVGK